MEIYDISVTIASDMPIYPGDAGVSIAPIAELGKGSQYALSRLVLGSHTGTHLDAPSHFIPDGLTVDQVPLEVLVGPAKVVEFTHGPAVTAAFLEEQRLPSTLQRVLFKTPNGALWGKPRFQGRFVYLEESAARWLVDRGVRLVGIDYLSVEQYPTRRPVVHLCLLSAGVVILEGLDLRAVPPGDYTLVCLPLKVRGCDGAPARAMLLEGGLG